MARNRFISPFFLDERNKLVQVDFRKRYDSFVIGRRQDAHNTDGFLSAVNFCRLARGKKLARRARHGRKMIIGDAEPFKQTLNSALQFIENIFSVSFFSRDQYTETEFFSFVYTAAGF